MIIYKLTPYNNTTTVDILRYTKSFYIKVTLVLLVYLPIVKCCILCVLLEMMALVNSIWADKYHHHMGCQGSSWGRYVYKSTCI